MLIQFYRVKHKPTGLYYQPGAWSTLSERGKIYSTGNNIINFMRGGCPKRWLYVGNEKTKKKYFDVLKKCGEYGRIFVGGEWKNGFKINADIKDFEIETMTFAKI